jgi:hypothetical protein
MPAHLHPDSAEPIQHRSMSMPLMLPLRLLFYPGLFNPGPDEINSQAALTLLYKTLQQISFHFGKRGGGKECSVEVRAGDLNRLH